MKRGYVYVCFIVLFTLFSYAEGDARNTYETTVDSANIDGKHFELKKWNYVAEQGVCIDEHGIFACYLSLQGQKVYMDGVFQDITPVLAFPQGDNIEHLLFKDPPGHWNFEHWSQIVEGLHREGDYIKARIRNYGGQCYEWAWNPPDYPQDCFNTYDDVYTLSVYLPEGGDYQCSGGPCCENGQFKSSNVICADHVLRERQCNNGCDTQSRYVDVFCSGTSAECNGAEIPEGDWSACDDCEPECEDPWNRCKDYSDGQCNYYMTCEYPCPQPPDEKCDSIDNDCDGSNNEGYLLGYPCEEGYGRCHTEGVTACSEDGLEAICSPPGQEPAPQEYCDNEIDDNCDGFVDEYPCGCEPGSQRECGYNNVGVCQMGTETCIWDEPRNAWRWDCDGAVWPHWNGEECNGLDDDCDGRVDEYTGHDCEESRQGACEVMGHTWFNNDRCCGNDAIEKGPWGPENCDDGWDNDCDALVDEWDDTDHCPVYCTDGTKAYYPAGDDNSQQCSAVKPYFCEYNGHPNLGVWMMNCGSDQGEVCGCPQGKQCNINTGICSSGDTTPPSVVSFEVIPDAAIYNQDIIFDVVLQDQSPIWYVNLHYAYWPMEHGHVPTENEIRNANYNPLNIHFYDDGQHDDGAANDKHYRGLLRDGFSQDGYYAFKIEAGDIYQNIMTDFMIGRYAVLVVYNFDIHNAQSIGSSGGGNDSDNVTLVSFPVDDSNPIYHRGEEIRIRLIEAEMGVVEKARLFFDENNIDLRQLLRRPSDSQPWGIVALREDTIPVLGLLQSFEPGDPTGIVIELRFDVANAETYPQRLLINFEGGTFRVYDDRYSYTNVPPFDAEVLDSGYAGQTQYMKDKITQIIREDYAPYGVEITTSDDPLPQEPYSTLHIAMVSDPRLLGLADSIDEYNARQEENAVVFVLSFQQFIQPMNLDVDQMSQMLANVGAHEAGHLLGLHHVGDIEAIMDTSSTYAWDLVADQYFKTADLLPEIFPVGKQDSPRKLLWTVGST